jgi:hypothetical protein
VSNASQHQVETCTHERRPGTTVCLHCRHAARIAARARRKRLMLRGSAVAIVLATLGAAGALGATAIRGRSASRNDDRATRVVASASQPAPGTSSATTAPMSAAARAPAQSPGSGTVGSGMVGSGAVAPQGEPSHITPAASSAALSSTALPTPIIPLGESPLRDGVRAVRDDSAVVLMFDTPDARTRIPEKFERFVRATLPQVYGAPADSALAHIPVGALAHQGSLLNELPIRGMRVALSGGWAIVLYPETRPGQDGPLVVRYRASVTK